MDETQATGTDAPAQDTAATQPSEADVQINTDAPEASQEVKETATEATDTAESKLYAGKYKSAEDLEKGYTELESKFGKETSEKAELTRILNEAFAVPEPTDNTTNDYEEPTQQADPIVEQLRRDNAVIKFMMAHQDADGQAMKDILANDPMLKQITGHDAKLEYAYLRSQNIAQPKAIAEAEKAGHTKAQAKQAEKQSAQVESASKSETVNEGAELMDKATGNYDRDTRDAARLALIRKHLVDI